MAHWGVAPMCPASASRRLLTNLLLGIRSTQFDQTTGENDAVQTGATVRVAEIETCQRGVDDFWFPVSPTSGLISQFLKKGFDVGGKDFNLNLQGFALARNEAVNPL
jgi:hypothetical protein